MAERQLRRAAGGQTGVKIQAGVWEKLGSKSNDGRERERRRCGSALELLDACVM